MNCIFLSFNVTAKPDIAKDLIEADDIVRIRLLQTSLTHF